MSLFTPKCTKKGCDWVGTPKDTESKMRQSVQMHIGRLHSKSIPTFSKKRHAHAHAHASGNGHVEIKTVLPSARRGAHETNGHAQRRKYTRRIPAAVAHAHSPGTDVKINHCYNCGVPMNGLAEGVVLAELIRNDPRIRAKVEKILAKV